MSHHEPASNRKRLRRPRATRARIAALAAVAGLAATSAIVLGAATGAASAHGAKQASSAPSCATSGLVVWLDTQGNGAAGSTYYKLELTNLSGHSCALAGYPGVSAVNLAGKQLGSSARREASPQKTVVLGKGATAVANLRIVVAGNFPNAKCHRVTAAGLRVYPPGQKLAKTVPFPFEACARSGPGYLAVSAVRKG